MKTFKPLKAVERLERLGSVDPATGVLQRALHLVLAARGVTDVLHGVPLGHPAHPFLVQLPTGSFAAAVPPAVATGLADWSAGHPRQLRAGLVHAGGNTLATLCFALSLAARIRTTGTGRARDGHGRWPG